MKTFKSIQIVAVLAAAVLFSSCNSCSTSSKSDNSSQDSIPVTQTSQNNVAERAKMQVVFLLDATGSMSGLINAAKDKIWSIVGSFNQTNPTPEIEIGMIFYRDRGDDFITKAIPLGTNMDELYEQLMSMQADGGGDGPESVNQALFEAVSEMAWDENSQGVYKSIFLVGDYPPHMDYQDDVKYPQSCEIANKKGIVINTILMGTNGETKVIWLAIANSTNGQFVQTDMNVNDISITTPYDKKISDLQYELDKTRVYYGSAEEQEVMISKSVQSEKIKSGSASVAAKRAEYNLSEVAKDSYYGSKELINDMEKGNKLTDIRKEELPKNLQSMSPAQLETYVKELSDKRKSLEKEIAKLSKQRQEYINAEVSKMEEEAVESSFDNVIFKAVQSQAEEKNIKIEGDVKR